jgi:hypothetical protein
MAVELRNWIEGELRICLPVVELMRSPSLSRLAELLAERITTGDDDRSATPGHTRAEPAHPGALAVPLPPLDAAPEALLERLDDLSGEQVDVLLAALLQQGHHGSR